MMYQRGAAVRKSSTYFVLIEWVMMLPPELEKAFKQDLIAYEDEEYAVHQQSERESEAKGKVELVIKQLSRRNQLSEETLAKSKRCRSTVGTAW